MCGENDGFLPFSKNGNNETINLPLFTFWEMKVVSSGDVGL